MKFQEYIHKKHHKNESQNINEFGGDEATDVDFGLFSWGGGGEIDAMAAATAAAGLVLAKSIYNGVIYGLLKAQLPSYLKQYKIAAAPKSRSVFDANYDKDKIDPLKKQKATLLGTGGSREDVDLRGNSVEEKSAKERIKAYFKAAIEKAPDEERKAAFREKRDKAIEQLDSKVQSIQNNIEKLENQKELAWEKIQEDWRQYSEKFEKKTDGFVEVRDSILASSFRKKWEKEFTIAKKEADIEVLDEAQKIATENKNKKELDAIREAKKRAEENLAAAEKSIKAVTDEADRAEAEFATLDELGVPQWMQANVVYNTTLVETYKKWAEIANNEGDKSKGGKADTLKYKIEAAEKKIEKGNQKAEEFKKAGDNEKADKVLKAIAKIESDIAAYKEELNKLGESLEAATYYSLSVRIDESVQMLDALLEEETKKETLNFSELRKIIQKGISAAPEEEQKKLASEAIADVEKIKGTKSAEIEAKNKMVELFDKFKGNTDEDKPDLPKGSEAFSKLKAVDPKEDMKTFDDAISYLKEQGGEVKTKPKSEEGDDNQETGDETTTQTTNSDDTESDIDKEKYEKLIAASEAEEDKHQKEVVEPLKNDLVEEKSKDPKDEKKIADLEIMLEEMELQTLKLKLTTARLKAESQGKDKNEDETYKSIMSELTDKTEALDAKKASIKRKQEEESESPELKSAKEELTKKEKDYEDIKNAKELGGVSTKIEKGQKLQKDTLEKIQKEIDNLKQKVSNLKGKSSEKKEESVETKIAPKYMKFEEFMTMKNQK